MVNYNLKGITQILCYMFGCGELQGVTWRSRNAFEPQPAYNVDLLCEGGGLNSTKLQYSTTVHWKYKGSN